jgi:hypothetical protein
VSLDAEARQKLAERLEKLRDRLDLYPAFGTAREYTLEAIATWAIDLAAELLKHLTEQATTAPTAIKRLENTLLAMELLPILQAAGWKLHGNAVAAVLDALQTSGYNLRQPATDGSTFVQRHVGEVSGDES